MAFLDIIPFLTEADALFFAAGQQIFDIGDIGDTMFFIVSGEVDISVDERQIDFLRPGEVFGEMALVENRVRSAAATAVSPCKLASIDKALFATLSQHIPSFATDVMAIMSIRLRRFMDEEVKRLKLQEEMAIGQKLQLSLLPESVPTIPGWAFAASYQAARQIGGDLYDFIPDPDDPDILHLVIADVTGKGVPAAMFMAVCRTIIRNEAQNGRSPAELIMKTNQHLMNEQRSLPFLTAFFGSLYLKTGRLVYASGGHDQPYWLQAGDGAVLPLDGQGMLLGAFPMIHIEEREMVLAPGDSLILYTDGITEARNETDFFDEEGLEAVIASNATASANQMGDNIISAVNQFTGSLPQSDDMTLVIVQRDKQ